MSGHKNSKTFNAEAKGSQQHDRDWPSFLDAISRGDKALTTVLADRLPALLDQKDENGMTPLHLAIKAMQEEIVAILVAKGADQAAQDNFGHTPLHWALALKLNNAVWSLSSKTDAAFQIADCNGLTPLHLAAMHGFDGVIRRIHKSGAKMDVADNSGHTALHWAGVKGKYMIAEYLAMQSPGLLFSKNNDGDTASEMTRRNGFVLVADMLDSMARSVRHAKRAKSIRLSRRRMR